MPQKTKTTVLQAIAHHARAGETGLALNALADWAEFQLADLVPKTPAPVVTPATPAPVVTK